MAGEGFCLYIHGRLHGVTRARLAHAVAAAGGRLVRRPSSRVTLVALGYGSALVTLSEAPPLALPTALPPGAEIISEGRLRRRLGLGPPQGEVARHLTCHDLKRAANLDDETLHCLALYDVIEPTGERFGFRDLRAAREVRRLLDLNFGLDEIVEAAVALRSTGRGLFDSSLVDAPWGEVVQRVAGRLGRLDGQYELPLDETFESVDDIFERAEEAELACDLPEAERLYRIALTMDRADPVLPFNLANVLDALGRQAEAALVYQAAIGRDPGFAEAWVNLAALQERSGRDADAISSLQRALTANPDCAEALFGLATLLTRSERYAEALLLWDQYVRLAPSAPERAHALRQLMLCRLETRSSVPDAAEESSSGLVR